MLAPCKHNHLVQSGRSFQKFSYRMRHGLVPEYLETDKNNRMSFLMDGFQILSFTPLPVRTHPTYPCPGTSFFPSESPSSPDCSVFFISSSLQAKGYNQGCPLLLQTQLFSLYKLKSIFHLFKILCPLQKSFSLIAPEM